MILLGLGGNRVSPAGTPARTLDAAVGALRDAGCRIVVRSPFYESAPVGPADQPWFVNMALAVECDRPATEMLALCHLIETRFGRVRDRRWRARTLDIDLLDWHDAVLPDREVWARESRRVDAPEELVLPHPRLHLRRFVLQPLADIAPGWRHPVLGTDVVSLLHAVADQPLRPLIASPSPED